MKTTPSQRAAALVLSLLAGGAGGAEPEDLVVTATRSSADPLDIAGNIARVTAEDLALLAATHPYEIAVRVPGTWINRNSGQEQLTAIRSPVLTGPGSCGAFLVLEDGIATRPTGFCNVNQLFEVPTEMADAIEVVRGPANAYYGSNGLHGTINTLLPTPGVDAYTGVRLDAGSNDFLRGTLRWDSAPGENAVSAGFMADHDGGYRADSGYEQFKGFLKSRHELGGGQLDLALTVSDLDQETAGFVTGFEAYKDPAVRFSNPNPEAYRNAASQRASATWTPAGDGAWSTEYRAYLRHSDMDFLQHFLPGQPVEENGQTSGGLLFMARRELAGGARLAAGIDTELARGFLKETQFAPADGSDFIRETRPVGKHYDYIVDSALLAAHASVTLPVGARWEWQAGVRAEYLRYDYDNKMLDGNTRDDGTPCGFGGCQFNRPADRTDSFGNIAPNVGVLYRFTDATIGFANVTRGFRAPQATELYRLQRNQSVADIDSEELDAIEAGVRHNSGTLALEAVAYYMRKRNFIFRDAEDANVSDGKTRHQGVEVSADWRFAGNFYLALTGSWSDQEYRFDRSADLGEEIRSGNEVDTAPQKLASARLGYDFSRGRVELEWAYTGDYFLDAANTARYDGHRIYNLRTDVALNDHWSLGIRLNNVTDEKYADRADILAVSSPPVYRYFTGHPREIYATLGWRL